ncbi:MAG: cell division protein ZapA [Rhizobium sp.]|jgi:cell division protein ZapA|nr:cell division protein ZapA [Rhizobium sp.]
MAQITVTVGGKPYRMACADGEEAHLESLARLVDGRISELRGSFGEIGDQRLTVMAAISIADEMAENKRTIARLNAEIASLHDSSRAAQSTSETWSEAVADDIEDAAIRIEKLAQLLNASGKS